MDFKSLKDKFNSQNSYVKGALTGAAIGTGIAVASASAGIGTVALCAAGGAWAWRKIRGF